MNNVKVVIDTCYSILNISIYLCGYHITLWQVFIFGLIGFLLLWLIFGILK